MSYYDNINENRITHSTEKHLSRAVTFDKNDAALFFHDKCDKYDYLIAVGCGVLAGLTDIFLVGAPGNSVLGKWTDTQVDKCVMAFAKLMGWKPRAGNENSVASAIGFLEKKYPVNYDHRHGGDVDNAFKMSTKNHHLKSLAHSPDIIGLFFSILNQFTSTATFISDGQLITVETDTYELRGKTVIGKLFCGCVNWFGHIMSDIAGSSGGRAKNASGRGSGVPIPFFELFQLCNFGEFQIGKDRQDLATLATRVFQEGYDFRFVLAMAIPVVLSELLIRTIWAVKRYFYHKLPLKECIPSLKHDNLRLMIIIAHGTLCVIDGIDAGIRSGGNALQFALRLNIIAWYRLICIVLKEVFIRLGIAADTQQYLESFRAVNEQLKAYIAELEKYDVAQFKKEADYYHNMAVALERAADSKALNAVLLEQYAALKLDVPWGEDFDDWMLNKTDPLIFD